VSLVFFIARRYFFGKKSHNLINWISGISVFGVFLGTLSLVIVLSVFNGFDGVVKSFYNQFDPDLKVSPSKGKFFVPDSLSKQAIQSMGEVDALVEVLEDNALVKYQNHQQIAVVKGVSSNFVEFAGLKNSLVDGSFVLSDSLGNYGIFGAGIAYYLSLNLQDDISPVEIYLPDQTSSYAANISDAFKTAYLKPAGVFSTQQEFDLKYVVVPLKLMQDLIGGQRLSSMEVLLKPDAEIQHVKERIEGILGADFVVKDRFQQQEILYNIMKSEKWAVFSILSFILLVATLTIVGALSMLIIEKTKDIAVLSAMGASLRIIRAVFLLEGLMICLSGALSGLAAGWLICWAQQTFGFIKINTSGSTFAIDSYPVDMQFADFALVLLTIVLIGFVSALIPTLRISAKRPVSTLHANQVNG
jgi:lipoprotein-releasing system permease protein